MKQLLIIFMSFILVSCAAKEELLPLYKPEVYLEGKTHLEFSADDLVVDLGEDEIEPTVLRKLSGRLFGWLPGVGDVLQLPINIANGILPYFKVADRPDLPADVDLTDPETLEIVDTAYIKSVTFYAERTKCYVRKRRCDKIQADFIKSVQIYFLADLREYEEKYKKPNSKITIRKKWTEYKVRVPLAWTQSDSLVGRIGNEGNITRADLYVTDKNIKELIMAYPDFRLEFIAKAKPPKAKFKLWGDASFQLNFKIKLPE